MKLALDFGNTSLKLALFDGPDMVSFEQFHSSEPDKVLARTAELDFDAGILASAIALSEGFVGQLAGGRPFYRLDYRSVLPFTIGYDTPETLGADRIAAAAGASAMFPGHPVLVIVAGTCITFDLVTPDHIYHGGAISPGIGMRLRAMHTFTDRLPLVPIEHETGLIGKTTEQSMLSGAINGTLAEVDGIIRRYLETWPELRVVISGGDLPAFAKYQKNSIFAVPNIVLNGLNAILETNLSDEENNQP